MQLQISLPSSPFPRPAVPLRRPGRLAISSAVATGSSAATSSMYELLSVPETAGPHEIKAAYRRQARRWHPDACPTTTNKELYAQQFMRARAAYEVLSNPVLRQDYDLALRVGAADWGWMASALRDGTRPRPRRGYGDWESQMEELRMRSASRSGAAPETWGSRMRSAGDRSD